MKTGWIDFKQKTPYSNVPGREPPYDFLILVAVKINQTIIYRVTTAIEATNNYQKHPHKYLAWTPIEKYFE